uniref:glutaminase n=1 Tax=Timema monikensis TaxID=170555 RepID=A0A7R9EJ58_9NEOP|nr:unnamed protein product [Timema monikensis]
MFKRSSAGVFCTPSQQSGVYIVDRPVRSEGGTSPKLLEERRALANGFLGAVSRLMVSVERGVIPSSGDRSLIFCGVSSNWASGLQDESVKRKPLTYGIALEMLGSDVVHQYVGQEPSGRNFNELVLDHNKKPHNPMINAGAILVCSLLKTLVKPEMTLAEKFDFTMNYFKRMAGGENLGFNNAVFLSEREAADRNYALGFYMREHKCYPEKTNLRECMDFYFQVSR